MGPGRRAAVVLAAPVLFLSACGRGNPDVGQIDKIVQDIAKDKAALCEHATTQLLGLLGGDKVRGGNASREQAARGYRADEPTGLDGDVKSHPPNDIAPKLYSTLTGDARHV